MNYFTAAEIAASAGVSRQAIDKRIERLIRDGQVAPQPRFRKRIFSVKEAEFIIKDQEGREKLKSLGERVPCPCCGQPYNPPKS